MTKTAMKKDIQPPAPIVPRKGRGGPRGYFTEVYRELKKVEWTAPGEVTRLTIVVLIVCAFVVAILWVLSQTAGTIIGALQGKG